MFGVDYVRSLAQKRKEVSEKRLEVCNECPFYHKEIDRCMKCSCFMKYKTLIPGADCPMGKWGNYEENLDPPTDHS